MSATLAGATGAIVEAAAVTGDTIVAYGIALMDGDGSTWGMDARLFTDKRAAAEVAADTYVAAKAVKVTVTVEDAT